MYERYITDAGGYGSVLPNPNLDKETMTAYEVGMFTQFGGKVSFDIAGFVNDYKNLIESYLLLNAGPTASVYQYQNIAKARIAGVETKLDVRPSDKVSMNVTYTYMHAKNKSLGDLDATTLASVNQNPDPDWLPYRPEHTASARLNWKATENLMLNTNARYVGKYKNINSETNPAGINYPGNFIVVNLGTKYQFTENISGTLACNNLFNEQYEEVVKFRAPGRSYVLGVDFSY